MLIPFFHAEFHADGRNRSVPGIPAPAGGRSPFQKGYGGACRPESGRIDRIVPELQLLFFYCKDSP